MRKVFERIWHNRDVQIEDSGQARIAEFADSGDEGIFVRVQSWSERKRHPEFDALEGRRVRVTIETIESGLAIKRHEKENRKDHQRYSLLHDVVAALARQEERTIEQQRILSRVNAANAIRGYLHGNAHNRPGRGRWQRSGRSG